MCGEMRMGVNVKDICTNFQPAYYQLTYYQLTYYQPAYFVTIVFLQQ